MMQTTRPRVFKITPPIKRELVKIIDERIKNVHVTREDFSELKNIVKDLAAAQKRTELKVEELAEAQKRTEHKVEELAEAQKRTELKVEELAEAQKRTEFRVEELAAAQSRTETTVNKLAEAIHELRNEVGGLSRTFGYAFENEAYRLLPNALRDKYGIDVKEKIIRAEFGGKEINLFCRAARNGKEILIVGEAKNRLDDRREKRNVFEELNDKVEAVISEYGQIEIAQVLITNYATKGFLQQAKERGVIVMQSFEW